ncbi:hypothetical protein TrispH2_005182 [Trichoplax sp. H2]|nr:hypothetical protein TrispH2_005182 [Trichoplax sp. H2]|eukprot:RDD42023.1 hypothetical protein TrispH2_005182 [Trichoplax sp. H2]
MRMSRLNAAWFELSPTEKLQCHFAEQDFINYVAGYVYRISNILVRKVSYNLRVFRDIREFLDNLATNECLGRVDEASMLKKQFLEARSSFGITDDEWAILVTVLNKLSVPTIGSNIITTCNFDIFNYYFERLSDCSLYKNKELWLKMISILEDTKY